MRRALTLALQEDADVYHFHDPELIRLGLALKRRGKKVIWDVHEHYPNSIRDKFYIPKILRSFAATAFDLYERAAVRSFDHIIYTTPQVGARYAKMKAPSTSVENYPIVELAETVEPDPQERMIYLGAMSRIRGLTQVIEAFGRIVQRASLLAA